MPFPDNIADLKAAGYVFDNDSHCRSCGASIEWWITPKGKKMPMDVQLDGSCESHWANCPDAKDWKK
jgi:hypothetical protein